MPEFPSEYAQGDAVKVSSIPSGYTNPDLYRSIFDTDGVTCTLSVHGTDSYRLITTSYHDEDSDDDEIP